MSTSNLREMPVNATLADCARLWNTLKTEYIPGLRIEWRISPGLDQAPFLSVEVVSDSAVDDAGAELVNVWAYKEFRSGLYLISYGQLFDLLIASHRKIDAYFRNGQPSAPTLRRK